MIQPQSRICVCSSHTEVSPSPHSPAPKNTNESTLSLSSSVPLLNLTRDTSGVRYGSSTNRKLGIAFGSIVGIGFFTGLLILLYLILAHRLRARSRSRSWKRQLNLRKLYLDRVSHRRRNTDLSVSITGPITLVGSDYSDMSLSGGGGGDILTDPFAVGPLDSTIPPLGVSKVSKSSTKSMSVRRDAKWRNFEDYDYI